MTYGQWLEKKCSKKYTFSLTYPDVILLKEALGFYGVAMESKFHSTPEGLQPCRCAGHPDGHNFREDYARKLAELIALHDKIADKS